MRILSCRYDEALAHEAFQLRYKVFIEELGYVDEAADHTSRLYTDVLDRYSRIYVALDDDERVVATARVLYFRDIDALSTIPESLLAGYQIEQYYPQFANGLAFSTKFVVAKEYRGSLVANLITSNMFADLYHDEIVFVLSSCGPSLIDLYHHLGFHFYAPPEIDANGLYFPIVLAVRDSDYLDHIRSPFRKILRRYAPQPIGESSVTWFYETFGKNLDQYVTGVDKIAIEAVLEKTKSLAAAGNYTVFTDFRDDDVRRIASACLAMKVLAGQTFIARNQQENDLYLIIKGTIDVSFGSSLGSMRVSAGEIIGIIDYFSGRRMTQCTAVTECTMIIIPQFLIYQFAKRDPALANAIHVNLGKSLALQFERLTTAA